MRDVLNIRSHVPLLAGNLYAPPSQGSMAFMPSIGLLERTKRSSAFNDFPQFSWSDLTEEEAIGRVWFGLVWFGFIWFRLVGFVLFGFVLVGFVSFGFVSQTTVSPRFTPSSVTTKRSRCQGGWSAVFGPD